MASSLLAPAARRLYFVARRERAGLFARTGIERITGLLRFANVAKLAIPQAPKIGVVRVGSALMISAEPISAAISNKVIIQPLMRKLRLVYSMEFYMRNRCESMI
ncbi:hypothetical protein [Pseudobacteriovorax antillogorgiicola]|uniref:Uncharacterized protein n=1 Tax=Pseudobacteriovorax antillogorgiicola TaxID=1513793 RepID=A0A1Y6C8E5_9BACT|nr:hypothetical protein [Pseudobacteriovorax antillogorgiicola]TCS51675.1 hypothetical protein EDD56_11060 [Pseudobacteriovorax antillogorgiicola]SMF48999.1 hypothetical protein SAMN06296036_11529 [Pseudobacteriovorax antillogorgiicola]